MPALIDLRTDEAYYWTWSKESVLSFLDHPPMVALPLRAGTALFGDTAFGARAGGLVAMAGMQWLLSDIVRRKTEEHRGRGFRAAGTGGDTLLRPDDDAGGAGRAAGAVFCPPWRGRWCGSTRAAIPRWWLAAGVFGGLALLSKHAAACCTSRPSSPSRCGRPRGTGGGC